MAGADYLAMVSDPEELLSVARSIDGPKISQLLGEYQQMTQTMAEVGQFGHDVDNAASSQLFGKFVDEAHHESAVLGYAALNIADTCNRMKAKLSNFYEQYVEKVRPAAQALQQAYDAQLGHGGVGAPAELRIASTELAKALSHLYTDLAGNPTINVVANLPEAAIADIASDGKAASDGGPVVGPGVSGQTSRGRGTADAAGQGGTRQAPAEQNTAEQNRAAQGGDAAGALSGALGALEEAGSAAGSSLAEAADAGVEAMSTGAELLGEGVDLASSLGGAAAQPAAAAGALDGLAGGEEAAEAAVGGLAGSDEGALTRAAAAADLAAGGAGGSPLHGLPEAGSGPAPELRPAPAGTGQAAEVSARGPAAASSGMMGMPMMGGAGMNGASGEHRVASYLVSKEQGERQFTAGLPLASEDVLGALNERELLAMQVASIEDPVGDPD